MTLSEKDAQLFYKLWLPLLDYYVNEKCKVNGNVKNIASAKSLDPQDVKEIANVLWDDVALIDQYLAVHGFEMPDEHKEIISSWKRCVQGRFVMERHLKRELFLWQKTVRCIRFRESYLVGKKCFGVHQCHY